MDIPDGATEKSDADAPWGTLEELLLACAVDRHGTDCWDSVAIEIQKRSSNSTFHHLLTPHHCKQRFQALERRYAPKYDASDSADDDDKKADTVRWLEELRKLRVAELRRELERYDLSIVSLQRKVKRLKEEGEEDPREGENGEELSDLAGREQEEQKRGGTESEPEASPESDRDNQSVNESNSTDPKAEDHKTRADEPEPAGAEKTEPDQSGLSKKPIEDDSCNGSSVDRDRNSGKAEQEAGPSESQAESEERTSKESSDMQSSASRFRKKGEPDKVRSGSVSGEERENEDQSVAVKRLSRNSQPYMDILEIVRSHKLGSVFERRLESQDTPEYRILIRQHMDLESILTRHKEGQYSGCYKKLYRDLLLLFNNAIIFFGKKSKEYAAASELFDLVSKEVSQRKLKLNPPAEEPAPPVAARPSSPKAELEPSDSLLRKPNISGPIIVCRKRSSIATKGPRSSSGADIMKREPKTAVVEEKAKFDWNEPSKSSGSAEEARITKKRTKDRFPPASSSLKKNSENLTKPNPKPNPDTEEATIASQNLGKGGGGGGVSSSSKQQHQKPKTDTTATVSAAKKRSAADFLNRMKQNSSPNKGPLVDTSKGSAGSSKNKGGSEQKKSGSGNAKGDDVKTDNPPRRVGSSSGRMVKEQESPTKRSAGRPPKRAAAPVPASVSGKRNRERVDDVKTVASRQQPKKRTRK